MSESPLHYPFSFLCVFFELDFSKAHEMIRAFLPLCCENQELYITVGVSLRGKVLRVHAVLHRERRSSNAISSLFFLPIVVEDVLLEEVTCYYREWPSPIADSLLLFDRDIPRREVLDQNQTPLTKN